MSGLNRVKVYQESPTQGKGPRELRALCKRVMIVTDHRIKMEREVNECMKRLMDSARGEFSGMEIPKGTKKQSRGNRVDDLNTGSGGQRMEGLEVLSYRLWL